MTIANYKMRVDERGALTILKEAQDVLQRRPGEEVQVSIDRIPATATAPNEKMLSILRGIQERHAAYRSAIRTDLIPIPMIPTGCFEKPDQEPCTAPTAWRSGH